MMEYPVWAWWNPWRLRSRVAGRPGNLRFRLGPFRAAKARALACHRSQVRPIAPWPRPVLPPSVARGCMEPVEIFFRSRIGPGAIPG